MFSNVQSPARAAAALFLAAVAACGAQRSFDDAARATDAVNAIDATADAPTSAADGGGPCRFNADCVAVERCECSEAAGCFCRAGVRGTGQSGVDPCTDGNDCATALCVEGADGGFVCSGPCAGAQDCGPALPRCTAIASLGMICVRNP